MKIQQHDGVVVDAAEIHVGLHQASVGGRGVARGREAPSARVRLPSLPPSLYRDPWGAPALGDSITKGAAAKGGALPPKASGGAPSPRVPNPRRRGAKEGAPAHQGLVPLPLQPMGPSGIGGPTRWTPGTLPVVPVQYR